MLKTIQQRVTRAGRLALRSGTALFLRAIISRQPRRVYPSAERLISEPNVDASVKRIQPARASDQLSSAVADAERSPGSVRYEMRWSRTAALRAVQVQATPDLESPAQPLAFTAPAGKTNQIEVDLPTPPDGPARPYFVLDFDDGARIVVAERVLSLESGVNFRDIGGYRTEDGQSIRWGRVFRSGSLTDLTDSDLEYLDKLGLKLICDLRTVGEAEKNRDRLPHGAVYQALPILDEADTSINPRQVLTNLSRLDEVMIRSYTEFMIDKKASVFGSWLRRLADPANLPTVVHCTAGKDRTGVAIALLLSALRVPDEVISRDYSLSNLYHHVFRKQIDGYADRLKSIGVAPDDLLPMFTANPATINASLAHIRSRYSGIEGYLLGPAGLDASVIDRLRELLLV